MTKEEAIKELSVEYFGDNEKIREAKRMAIKALEQAPRKDEVILTNEEYRKLVSNEYENGYARGYREALEQEPILDKIRAEIEQTADEEQKHDEKWAIGLRYAVKIIDKYKAESEG